VHAIPMNNCFVCVQGTAHGGSL